MKLLTAMMVAGAIAAAPAIAQERSAGQAYDAQVNWAALSAKLNALDAQNKALAASLTTLQSSMNTLTATVNALSSKVLVMDGKLSAIGACGAQKKYWNGSGCVAPGAASLPTVQTAALMDTRTFPDGVTRDLNAFCVAHGYDAATSSETVTATRHVGGRTGSDETYVVGEQITCLRVVNR